ncbi:MAG: MFS transporter [Tissierellia bacterium]|nr:MFS transporter [Tissierellia bacterium]
MKNKLKILLGSLAMLMTGLMYGWSVLSRPIGEDLKINQGNLSLVFTFAMAFFCLGGLGAGYLKTRNKGHYILSIALFLMVFGYFFASFAKGTLELFIGYGFCVGFSVGLIYTYLLSNLTPLIPKKQGLISGILLFGFGMSSMIFGPLYTHLIDKDYFTWRQLFRIFSMIIFFMILLLVIFIPDQKFSKRSRDDDRSVDSKTMLQTRVFRWYFLWTLSYTAIGIATISQGATMIKTSISGISDSIIAIIIGVLSLSNGLGRILIGYLFDHYGRKISMLSIGAMAILSQIMLLMNLKFGTLSITLVAFILVGLFYGGVPSNNSAFTMTIFGEKYYSMNLSYLNLNLLLASFASVFAGKLFDRHHSYFILLFLTLFISLIAMAIHRFLEKEMA